MRKTQTKDTSAKKAFELYLDLSRNDLSLCDIVAKTLRDEIEACALTEKFGENPFSIQKAFEIHNNPLFCLLKIIKYRIDGLAHQRRGKKISASEADNLILIYSEARKRLFEA